jgi:hypothetical protein
MMHAEHGDRQGGAHANAANAELVKRTVVAIDGSDMGRIDVLLRDLVCAAWPTARAQSQ